MRASVASLLFAALLALAPPCALAQVQSTGVHVYRLRLKLAPHGLRIETMVNVGYSLRPDAGARTA